MLSSSQVCDLLQKHIPNLQILNVNTVYNTWGPSFEIQAEYTSKVILFDITTLPQLRLHALLGQLAVSALKMQHRKDSRDMTLVALVCTLSVSKHTLLQVFKFMTQYLPHIGWGILTQSEGLRLAVPSLNIDVDHVLRLYNIKKPRMHPLIFTDLIRWMLKILLLNNISNKLWSGPRLQAWTPQQLQSIAGVSSARVYSFVTMLKENDFLRKWPQGFQLVRVGDLIQSWFSEERRRPSDRFPVRGIYRVRPALQVLAGASSKAPVGVVGGFQACRLLDVAHTPVTMVDIHIQIPFTDFMRRFDLEPCNPDSAQIHLVRAAHNRSIFQGTGVIGGIQVVDIFQAALDVINHPARGLEQAEHIAEFLLNKIAKSKN